MGLGTHTHSNVTYLRVGQSKDEKGRLRSVIGKRCEASTLNAKPVYKADGTQATDKNGNGVFRLEYDFIEGKITKLTRTEDDYGKYLDVTIEDGADVYALRLDRGERYWADFCLRLPMLNLLKPARLQPYSIEGDDGKTNKGIAMKQDGQKVDRKWSQERGYDGGPPQATFDEDEKEWKYGKRNNWIDDNIVDPIASELAAMNAPVAAGKTDDDDVPF